MTYELQRILSACNIPTYIWRPQFLQPIFLIILPELKTCRANMRFSESGILIYREIWKLYCVFSPETLVSTALHSTLKNEKISRKNILIFFFQFCGIFEELLNELVQPLLLCCLYFLSEIYILFRSTHVYVFFFVFFESPLIYLSVSNDSCTKRNIDMLILFVKPFFFLPPWLFQFHCHKGDITSISFPLVFFVIFYLLSLILN